MIYTVPVRSAVPLVYVCMDARGHFFALTIYGLEENKFPLSHSKNKALQVNHDALFHSLSPLSSLSLTHTFSLRSEKTRRLSIDTTK